MDYKLGFIGAGHMGGALIEAACKTVDPREVLIHDKSEERMTALTAEPGCVKGSAADVVGKCRYIFLGVKPQNMVELFAEISSVLCARKDRFVLISMAAGYAISQIQALSGCDAPVIRIMPNTPVAVGSGCVLYDCSPEVEQGEISEFLGYMAAGGDFLALEENLIDAGCSVSGCGPAFVYKFIIALAKAGEKLGLPHEKAVQLSESTVLGAAKLAIESGKDPETLCREVCSPGGSTIEGVRVLENSEFDSIIEATANASFKRNRELGKK